MRPPTLKPKWFQVANCLLSAWLGWWWSRGDVVFKHTGKFQRGKASLNFQWPNT